MEVVDVLIASGEIQLSFPSIGLTRYREFRADETDQEFWREIDQLGWKYIDHEAERTSERLGL